tara:strand:- start:503 stop:619 length:117 start_codon:yes stop_codon:yes gene_type:complete
MNSYFTDYPTHIEVPEGYWVSSIFFENDVEYLEKNEKN